jgi:aminopeptidase N
MNAARHLQSRMLTWGTHYCKLQKSSISSIARVQSRVPCRRSLSISQGGRSFGYHSLRPIQQTRIGSSSTIMTVAHAKDAPVEKFRKDYEAVPYTADTVQLLFKLGEEVTTVESEVVMKPLNVNGVSKDVFLNGRDDVVLKEVCVDGKALSQGSDYELDGQRLRILASAIPAGTDSWTLQVVTELKPQDNTLLEGLYKSSGNFCTQCEAEGFRGIAYFLDRPDVMATYKTRIEADKEKYPVLLSNGNLIDSGDMEGGLHYAVWEDPFKKPCYLFALVAGKLSMKEDTFTTMSGKNVTLRIFVQEENIGKVDFAMESLKRSMKWDEDTFGLEYDLEIFNIVAVDDFNMGAMENKSLNIFNSRLVLATPDMATDGDFARIEGVVGHEYFHNWTGNRVTCRDWFQLTLKEGLTVYRDQEFSGDMNSRPVQRITDVMRLRSAQFTEDAGPMAHPVRPDSYIKMDNFYTVTVYEKGAEVVRMYETLVGKDGFRKGMDLYFQRHDGQAVTCDDFLAAMADANGEDLSDLSKWYGQAGTPVVKAKGTFDSAAKSYTLTLAQTTPSTPGQDVKIPVLIPVRVSLLGQDGSTLPLRLQGSSEASSSPTEMVLRLSQESQQFVFEGIDAEPVPSLLRGFSAPVKLDIEGQSDDNLEFILTHDSDPFNRWEAGQILGRKRVVTLYNAAMNKAESESIEEAAANAGGVSSSLVEAFRSLLKAKDLDGQYRAYAIGLPSTSELVGAIPHADPVVLHKIRSFIVKEIANQLRPDLEATIAENEDAPGTPYQFSAEACARRALKNRAVTYLASLKDNTITESIFKRFKEATNMTDEISALAALDIAGGAHRDEAFSLFFEKWKGEPLVLLKWFTLQAESNQEGNIDMMKKLIDHPSFNIKNPNNNYSLFGGFSRSAVNFHAADGSGYQFMADAIIKLDGINHQVAARLVAPFTAYKGYDASRQELMKKELERIVAKEGLSDNVYEIVSKSLA